MAKLKTGRHTSGQKADRQAVKRAVRNKAVRKGMRAAAKELLAAIESKDAAQVKKLYPKMASLWDKAAKRGVIADNAAARKKSRLARKANAVLA